MLWGLNERTAKAAVIHSTLCVNDVTLILNSVMLCETTCNTFIFRLINKKDHEKFALYHSRVADRDLGYHFLKFCCIGHCSHIACNSRTHNNLQACI